MSYEYHEPATAQEAAALLTRFGGDAYLLAGGTAFAILYRGGLIRPGHVVGLRRCAELRGIRRDADGSLWIGAHATHREVERSATVRAQHAAIADAFARIATVRIRHQATIGGNLAHADPAQDPPPVLMAFDAAVRTVRGDGTQRDIAIDGLFVDHFTTTLAADEVILGVRVPPVAPGTRATYLKYLPRSQDDYATVSVAAALRLGADGRVAFARVALGAVGPVPVRATAVENAIIGEPPTPERIRDAAALVAGAIDPIDDARGGAAYKRDMAVVWTRRGITEVAA
jgi:aerobic carbon-monoxide dehydrogenase medium subunit